VLICNSQKKRRDLKTGGRVFGSRPPEKIETFLLRLLLLIPQPALLTSSLTAEYPAADAVLSELHVFLKNRVSPRRTITVF
jgi:hypothetical protein